MKEIIAHGEYVKSISYSRDYSKLVSGSYDFKFKVWDTKELEMLKEVELPREVMTVQFADSDRIVAGCCDGVIRTFDTNY